jgi:type 1 glutamine amidotransferase
MSLTRVLLLTACLFGIAMAASANKTETLVPVPPDKAAQIPPGRTPAEVEAVLKGAPETMKTRPIHIVLVAGKKDHGPGEHDYPAWQKAWQLLLARGKNVKVTTAWERPSDGDFKSADVMVLFKRTAWSKEMNDQFDAYLARGGGVVLLHYAVDGARNPESVGKHIGLYWKQGSRFRHGWLDLAFNAESDSPILRGFQGKTVRFHDETYWRLSGDPGRIDVLATSVEKEEKGDVTIPLLWSRRSGKGRVHVNILGHYNWTFNDPLFRILLLRGIAWAAGQPVDRFNDLVTVGVRLKG